MIAKRKKNRKREKNELQNNDTPKVKRGRVNIFKIIEISEV